MTSALPIMPKDGSSYSLEKNGTELHVPVLLGRGPSDQSSPTATSSKPSIKTKLVKKIKKIAKASNSDQETSDASSSEHDEALDTLSQNPAFNTSQIVRDEPSNKSKLASRALKTAQVVGSSIIHPVDAAKHKAAKKTAAQLSKADRPFLSADADLDYLQAHDELKDAETRSMSDEYAAEEKETHVGLHRSKVEKMEEHRESLRAAWMTSRHVRRVRVARDRPTKYLELELFTERDSKNEIKRRDVPRWLGNFLIWFTQDYSARYVDEAAGQPFDIDTTRHLVERLVMLSGSWQTFLMKSRAVCRWEDPRVTLRWLALYLFLWYTQYIVSYIYGYVIYLVVRNYYYPTSIDSLRLSMNRAQSSRDNAHKISELMHQKGGNWLEPLLEEFGPMLQMQLSDTIEFMEVLYNFYHWVAPRKTAATVFFFASCLSISLLTDMGFCVKIVWFVVGLNFFIAFPISSRYPKYRHIISSIKWVYWDIPTHSEWSFQYLQKQASPTQDKIAAYEGQMKEYRKALHNQEKLSAELLSEHTSAKSHELNSRKDDDAETASFCSAVSSTSSVDPTDIRSFRAYLHGGTIGRFTVFTQGVRFVRSRLLKTEVAADDEIWKFDFEFIVEMQKFDDGDEADVSKTSQLAGRLVKTVSSLSKPGDSTSGAAKKGSGGLRISCEDGTSLVMNGMRERDEAFNTVIAFSRLRWKTLLGTQNEERVKGEEQSSQADG